jgi:hypothetical protein
MIAFAISVNGQSVGTIGIGDCGVLTAHVTWSALAGEPGDLRVSFGGLDTRSDEHVHWPNPPDIRVGDTVTIQVVDTDAVDPPTERKTPAQLREDERTFLAEMEAEHQARLAAEGVPGENSDPQRAPPVRRVRRDPDDELPPLAAPWE